MVATSLLLDKQRSTAQEGIRSGAAVAANRRKTDVKKLLTGVVAFTVVVGSNAVAQESRVQAYDRNGNLVGNVIKRGNYAARYNLDGSLTGTFVRHGNVSTAYDPNGRPGLRGVRRGNVMYFYDRNGRPTGSGAVYNSDNTIARIYDRNGHLKSYVKAQ